LWQRSGLENGPVRAHIIEMSNEGRYEIKIGDILTETFSAADEASAQVIISDMCTGRESIASLPPDTEITVTAPDGTVQTTTLEASKRFR
jgi:hypothetical protein